MTVCKIVETGDPASSISSLAREWNAGLIMMPTRGQGIFRAALLGSVAAKVLHDADCPVWTAAHVEMLTEGRHIEWRNVICAIDLSAESSQPMQAARDLGRITGATIRIARAVPGEEAIPRQQEARSIQEMSPQAGTNFEVCIETDDLPHAIANCVRRYDADSTSRTWSRPERFTPAQSLLCDRLPVQPVPCSASEENHAGLWGTLRRADGG